VATFDVDAGRGNWSTNAVLHLHYAAGAQGELPPRLFLKMVNTDLGEESFGASEVAYYTRDYLGVAGAPLVRCYDAAHTARQRRYHLLLDGPGRGAGGAARPLVGCGATGRGRRAHPRRCLCPTLR
jgi:hypothetical protein